MSPCAKCSAPMKAVNVPDVNGQGHFKEVWRCVNGHYGYVEGREQDPPTKWDHYGPAYEEY